MKFTAALLALPLVGAFAPSATFVRKTSSLAVGDDPNVIFGTYSYCIHVLQAYCKCQAFFVISLR